MDIFKILIILVILDFIGYIINESFLKFKEKLYVMYGFVIMVGCVQLFSIPLIVLHTKIIYAQLGLLISIFIIIWLGYKKKVNFRNYALHIRLKNAPIYYVVLYLIFGILLSLMSFTTSDQWLYLPMVSSSLSDSGIYSLCGPWYCEFSSEHFFNSYYLFNAIIIKTFNVNHLEFIFGIYRFIDGLVIFQALMLLTTFLNKNKKTVFLFILFGLLGIGILSPHPFTEASYTMLFNGMNGTLLYQTVFSVLIFKFIQTKNDKYIYISLPFVFAITTTIYVNLIFLLIVFKFLDIKIDKKILILISFLYLQYYIPVFINNKQYILIPVLMLFLLLASYIYVKVDKKVLLYLFVTFFILISIISGNILGMFLYKDVIFKSSFLTIIILLSVILLVINRGKINENLWKYSAYMLGIIVMIITFSRYSGDIKFLINIQQDVVVLGKRLFFLFPYQILIIGFILNLNNSIIKIVSGYCIIVIVFASFYNQDIETYMSISESVNYINGNNRHTINQDINELNGIMNKNGYPETEILFHENETTLWPASEIPNNNYISGIVNNVAVTFEDSPYSEDFCLREGKICVEAFPKASYSIKDYDFQTKSYYYVIDN